MCFEYDMSHIDSKPRIHRPRADQASQTEGRQTQFLKEGMVADAGQRGDGENRQIIHTNTHKLTFSGLIWVNPICILSKLTTIFPTMWVSTAGTNIPSR